MMKQIDQAVCALKDSEYREVVGNMIFHPSEEVSYEELKGERMYLQKQHLCFV
ncbi:TPA: hypothetical protein ROX98_004373 [Bacillus pseudomycoides]|nr:hypothetical protein [Bacillus pseudomycoides]